MKHLASLLILGIVVVFLCVILSKSQQIDSFVTCSDPRLFRWGFQTK